MPQKAEAEFIESTHSNVRCLNNVLKACNSINIPNGDLARLIDLQKQITKTIEDVNNIIQPRVTMKVSALLNKVDKPSKRFSRTKFYSSASPYNNKKDKSNSFRIVPPMTLKKELGTAAQNKQTAPSQFLLSSLQLLENIRNLERLHNSTNAEKNHAED